MVHWLMQKPLEGVLTGKSMRQGIKYDCNIHSGRKCSGSTIRISLELLTDSVILAYVAWHGIQGLDQNNR